MSLKNTRGRTLSFLVTKARAHILGCCIAALAMLGCDRGCLRRVTGRDVPEPDPAGLTGLSGSDCSDGLARCADGRVEVSRAAHLPYPCGKPGESNRSCTCPWDAVERCRNGCALEGSSILAERDASTALGQLCKPDEVVARPLTAADPQANGVCADEGWTCRDGLVRACSGAGLPVRPLAICIHGCAAVSLAEGESPPVVEGKTVDGPAAILCRRDHN